MYHDHDRIFVANHSLLNISGDRQYLLDVNCFVSAANLADVKGAKAVLAPVLEHIVRIETIFADQSYKGLLAEVLFQAYHCELKVTEKLGDGFIVAPWRWVADLVVKKSKTNLNIK